MRGVRLIFLQENRITITSPKTQDIQYGRGGGERGRSRLLICAGQKPLS